MVDESFFERDAVASQVGRYIGRISIDFQFRLLCYHPELNAEDWAEVVISNPFMYWDANGGNYHCDPEGEDRTELGPALHAFNRVIKTAALSRLWELTIGFDDASRIWVSVDGIYEPWQIRPSEGGLAVCPPGGWPLGAG